MLKGILARQHAGLQAKSGASSAFEGLVSSGQFQTLFVQLEVFPWQEVFRDILKPGYVNQRIEHLKKRAAKSGKEAGKGRDFKAYGSLAHARKSSSTGSWMSAATRCLRRRSLGPTLDASVVCYTLKSCEGHKRQQLRDHHDLLRFLCGRPPNKERSPGPLQ